MTFQEEKDLACGMLTLYAKKHGYSKGWMDAAEKAGGSAFFNMTFDAMKAFAIGLEREQRKGSEIYKAADIKEFFNEHGMLYEQFEEWMKLYIKD